MSPWEGNRARVSLLQGILLRAEYKIYVRGSLSIIGLECSSVKSKNHNIVDALLIAQLKGTYIEMS